MLAVSSSAWAQSSLPDLSLEDLMKLDAGQVFGASERLQPVTEAPASVSFITAEEIARYGYRTLADILRGVRGMYVTNDRNFSLIGTRGFAKPGDYNSRILLLVNGHRVNDNVFGQAEIGAEFGLDPAMFERVEIIRGPASSLYGDSAFFAVVNVITRTGASLGGGSITLETGTLGTQLVRASVGHRLANGVDVALSGTYEHSDGVGRLYFPAFDTPATNNGVAEGLDGEGVRQFYGRLTFKGLTVTGAYGSRQRDVPTASFGTLFNEQDSREQTTDRHTLVDAEYGRSFGGTRVTFRASFDRFSYDGIYPFAGEPDGAPPLVGAQRRGRDAVERRQRTDPGLPRPADRESRGRVHRQHASGPDRALSSIRRCRCSTADRSSTQHAVYVQDEIKLARWFIVNAGLRYDGYEEFVRVTPRAALIVLPSSTQSLKYLYGSAFRAPNAYELNTFYFGEQVDDSAPGIDRHARARVGTLYQRLAANVRLDVLVQGRPADHPDPRRLDASGRLVRQPGGSAGEGPRARSADAPQRRIAGADELRASERRGSGDACRASEFAASRGQGADQPARADAAVVRVGGGTVSQQPRRRLPARRCRRRRPSTSPWSSRSDAPGSSSAACETSSTPSIRTPLPVSTGRTPSRRTAERPGSDSDGSCGRIEQPS